MAGGTSPGISTYLASWPFIAVGSPPGDQINDGAVTVMSSRGRYLERKLGSISTLLNFSSLIPDSLLYQEKVAFPEGQWESGKLSAPFKPFFLNHDGIKESPAVIAWVIEKLENKLPQVVARVPVIHSNPSADVDWKAVEDFNLSLLPGTMETRAIPLTGEGKARWLVSLEDGATTVRLSRPDGAGWIAGSEAGVSWEITDDAPRRTLTIGLDQPEPGAWEIELNGSALARAAGAAVSVVEDSPFSLETNEPGQIAAGASVPLLAAATWENGLVPVAATGGTVGATVVSPNGEEIVLTLLDDGQQADGLAGDGVHGLLADEFTAPGDYHALVRFDATHPGNGRAVRRVARTDFTRAASGGFITGVEGQRVVDTDADGYAEAVILNVNVANTEAGDFSLSGTLAETDGDGTVDTATEFHRDGAGSGVVNLVFDARNLPQGRECGPFTLTPLDLRRTDGERVWLNSWPGGNEVSARMFNGYSRFLRVTGVFNCGWVKVGQTVTRTLQIHNDGWTPMLVSGITLPSGFSGDYQGEIEAGGSREVEIRFEPNSAGTFGGGFEITSDANAGTVDAVWSGTGYEGVLLDDWLSDAGIPPDQSGPLDDPDEDGVPNLLAYLFDLPPGASDRATALPTPGIGQDTGGRYLAIRYRHNRNVERLVVGLETSDELAPESWTPIDVFETVEIDVDPSTGDPIRELRVRLGPETRKFVRMVVREAK